MNLRAPPQTCFSGSTQLFPVRLIGWLARYFCFFGGFTVGIGIVSLTGGKPFSSVNGSYWRLGALCVGGTTGLFFSDMLVSLS